MAAAAGHLDDPQQAITVRQGHFIVINGRPCEVDEVVFRPPHWRRFVGYDIFTRTRYQSPEFAPNHQVQVPYVHRRNYRIIHLEGIHLQLTNGAEYKDFRVTDRDLLHKIRTRLAEDRHLQGASPLAGTVLSSMGEEQLCGYKTVSPVYYHDWD